MALTPCVVLKCMTPPATNGGCWVACTRHAAMLVRPCSMMSSTLLAASMETTSSTQLKPTTLKQTSGAPVPKPSPIPKSQGPGNQMGAGGYLTQTNRLSDVIVLCDVLYVCGRVGGWVFEAWGWSLWVLLHRSYPWAWFFLQCLGGGGPLGVAESNIKPLHIAYFIFFCCCIYCCFSFSILRRMPTFIAHWVYLFELSSFEFLNFWRVEDRIDWLNILRKWFRLNLFAFFFFAHFIWSSMLIQSLILQTIQTHGFLFVSLAMT